MPPEKDCVDRPEFVQGTSQLNKENGNLYLFHFNLNFFRYFINLLINLQIINRLVGDRERKFSSSKLFIYA